MYYGPRKYYQKRYYQGYSWLLWTFILLLTAAVIGSYFYPLSPHSDNILNTTNVNPLQVDDNGGLENLTCIIPLPESCHPASLTNLEITSQLTLSGNIECLGNNTINSNCFSQNLNFGNVIIQNLTAIDFIHTNMIDMNETTITADSLLVKNITLTNSMTCVLPAVIDQSCFPQNIIFGNLFVENITINNSNGTCVNGPLNESCIPQKDAQEATTARRVCTKSNAYRNLPGLSITASNSGVGTYIITANAEMKQFNRYSKIFIIVNVDGVDIPLSKRTVQWYSKHKGVISTQTLVPNIKNGQIIKVRWKTNRRRRRRRRQRDEKKKKPCKHKKRTTNRRRTRPHRTTNRRRTRPPRTTNRRRTLPPRTTNRRTRPPRTTNRRRTRPPRKPCCKCRMCHKHNNTCPEKRKICATFRSLIIHQI